MCGLEVTGEGLWVKGIAPIKDSKLLSPCVRETSNEVAGRVSLNITR